MTNSDKKLENQAKTFFWLSVAILAATLLLLVYGHRGAFSPVETGDLQQAFIEIDTLRIPVTQEVIDWEKTLEENQSIAVIKKTDTIGIDLKVRYRFYTMDQFGKFHETGLEYLKKVAQ